MSPALRIELWITWTGACDGYNVAIFDHARGESSVDVVPLAPALDAHHALERAVKDVRARYGFEVPLFLSSPEGEFTPVDD